MKVRISAVIITYNEARNIVRCLKSLEGISDEIVVVDSYSNDETEILCKPFDVRFIQHPFEGYMQQKSWACNQAEFDVILSLDADEQLSDELRSSILAVKAEWRSDAYSFNRLTNYLGKWIRHCGWYPDTKLRLWDRRKGAWTGLNLHESVKMNEDARIVRLKGDLLHFSYYSIQQHLNQINSFTEIAAREGIIKGKNTSVFVIVLKTVWKFKRDYFFKLGFLDGYYGLIVCAMSAYTVFVKYIKMRELKKVKA